MNNLMDKLVAVLNDWNSDPDFPPTRIDVVECFTDLYPEFSNADVQAAINSAISDDLFTLENGCLKTTQ